jgi:hypothetical protein
MIAPDIVIEDLEPDGFAWLCRLASARQRRAGRWAWVLHHGGDIASAWGCDLDQARQALERGDTWAAAETLVAADELDRVVLLDLDQTKALEIALHGRAQAPLTQDQLFSALTQEFWSSPAVVTAPVPPRDQWSTLAREVASIGDGVVVLAVYSDDVVRASLVFTVVAGRLVHISSLDALTLDLALRGWQSHEQLEQARRQRLGATQVLTCDASDLEAAFIADDLASALLALFGR